MNAPVERRLCGRCDQQHFFLPDHHLQHLHLHYIQYHRDRLWHHYSIGVNHHRLGGRHHHAVPPEESRANDYIYCQSHGRGSKLYYCQSRSSEGGGRWISAIHSVSTGEVRNVPTWHTYTVYVLYVCMDGLYCSVVMVDDLPTRSKRGCIYNICKYVEVKKSDIVVCRCLTSGSDRYVF